MIKSIKYKVDKTGKVGLKHKMQRVGNRIETLVFLDNQCRLIQPMTSVDNIFVPATNYGKHLYFPYNKVGFIGKAVIKLAGGRVESMALSQFNSNNSVISAYNVSGGEIIVDWQSVVVTREVRMIIENFCSTFIINREMGYV